MGETDEALLYGEKFSTVPWIQLVTAQAYRAGAAASEARIKALEAMVRKLVALHDTPIHPGDTYEVARAMVKVADQ